MKARRVRMGVVGCGIWGRMHMRAYSQHPSADLVAICDSDKKRALQAAREFGVPQVFTDVTEMLRQNLEGISVATPDTAHAQIAIAAAKLGMHILVEKPLATTVKECQQMIAAAHANDVYLMVDWHNRWNPPYYHAWSAIQAGEIGAVHYIYYRLSDTIYVPTKMLPWAGKSTVMLFLGSHALDTTCWLIGSRPTSVFCRRKEGILKSRRINTADMYITLLDFENGATAVVENSWVLPQSSPSLIDHKCEIVGNKGVIYVDPTHGRAIAKYTEKTLSGFPDAPFPDMFITPEVQGKQMGFGVESIYHFVECIRDGKKPLTSGEDGLLNTRLILAAEESGRTGKTVRL
ncbi:MAG TPA: Gfo/Idh/MocA family oxidoreductase [Terriglobales bacterium]|nr:Gfo/Idh/MocA family oxidoreductase [Terriglobales bacterium]